jgi:hypothetical protein
MSGFPGPYFGIPPMRREGLPPILPPSGVRVMVVREVARDVGLRGAAGGSRRNAAVAA